MDQDICNTKHSCTDELNIVKSLSSKLELDTKRLSILDWKNLIEQRKQEGFYKIPSNGHNKEQSSTGFEISLENQIEQETEILSSASNDPVSEGVSIDSQEVQPLKNSIQPICVRISSKEQLGAGDETASKCSLPSRSSETSNLSLRRRCSPCESITEALANIRRDLMLMHLEDHTIARRLLDIRQDIVTERAKLSCNEYAEMLDDFSYELEEAKFLEKKLKVGDIPSVMLRRKESLLSESSPLRPLGVRKASMDFKRFSVI